MFTGIIQAMGRVVELKAVEAGGRRLVVDAGGWAYRPEPGQSVAVQGCCLTHAPEAQDLDGDEKGLLVFDVIPQTLHRTNLGELSVDDPVNLEPSLTPSTPIGGHFVQGHVDGPAQVLRMDKTPSGGATVTLRIDPPLTPYIVPRGSIAIDGVSLTVASVEPDRHRLSIGLIPTTLRTTTLGFLKASDRVNVETDMLARTVVHFLEVTQRNESNRGA